MLNPKKIWHEYLTHRTTSPVRCSHFTLGSPVIFQQYYSYILQIIYVIWKENKLQLLNCSLTVYLLLFNASYYLHSSITISGTCYRRSTWTEYQSAIWTNCSSGLLRLGKNLSKEWCTKVTDQYTCRRWSLWTLAVTLLNTWHPSCHTSQPVLFRTTNASL